MLGCGVGFAQLVVQPSAFDQVGEGWEEIVGWGWQGLTGWGRWERGEGMEWLKMELIRGGGVMRQRPPRGFGCKEGERKERVMLGAAAGSGVPWVWEWLAEGGGSGH